MAGHETYCGLEFSLITRLCRIARGWPIASGWRGEHSSRDQSYRRRARSAMGVARFLCPALRRPADRRPDESPRLRESGDDARAVRISASRSSSLPRPSSSNHTSSRRRCARSQRTTESPTGCRRARRTSPESRAGQPAKSSRRTLPRSHRSARHASMSRARSNGASMASSSQRRRKSCATARRSSMAVSSIARPSPMRSSTSIPSSPPPRPRAPCRRPTSGSSTMSSSRSSPSWSAARACPWVGSPRRARSRRRCSRGFGMRPEARSLRAPQDRRRGCRRRCVPGSVGILEIRSG